MAADQVKIDVQRVELAREIVDQLSKLKKESSFSFALSEEGHFAMEETLKLIEWGIGGNKPKIKETAVTIFAPMLEAPTGTPINLHLDEYDLKSIGEVLAVIDRSLAQHKDGVLK